MVGTRHPRDRRRGARHERRAPRQHSSAQDTSEFLRGALDVEEQEAELGLRGRQHDEHGVGAAARHQGQATIGTDQVQLEVATAELGGDPLGDAEQGGGHGRDGLRLKLI